MKKALSLILMAAMIISMAAMGFTASAAGTSAFDKETFRISKDTLMYDNTDNDGGSSGHPLQYAQNYGTGRNGIGDFTAYQNIDFGSKGASKVTVNFGFHKPEAYTETKIAVYIDKPFGAPIAEWTVKKGETADSAISAHKEFSADVQVTPGKHDVYLVATNDASGSWDYMYFTEASSTVKATKTLTSYALKRTSVDAFKELNILDDRNLVYWKVDQSKVANKTNIQKMEANGIGYSFDGDLAVFPALDFGKTGAKKLEIDYANGGTNKPVIGIYIDSPFSEPIAKLTIDKNTGGWDLTKTATFSVDLDATKVGMGVHDLIIKFESGTGSFAKVRLTAGDKDLTPPKAETTPDLLVGTVIVAVASLAGVVVSKRK